MAVIEYVDNPYMLYEIELSKDLPKAKLPGFTHKLLVEELEFFEEKLAEAEAQLQALEDRNIQNSLEGADEQEPLEDIRVYETRVKFFNKEIDRVSRELACFSEVVDIEGTEGQVPSLTA